MGALYAMRVYLNCVCDECFFEREYREQAGLVETFGWVFEIFHAEFFISYIGIYRTILQQLYNTTNATFKKTVFSLIQIWIWVQCINRYAIWYLLSFNWTWMCETEKPAQKSPKIAWRQNFTIIYSVDFEKCVWKEWGCRRSVFRKFKKGSVLKTYKKIKLILKKYINFFNYKNRKKKTWNFFK